jgi:hypothetical protein
LTTVVHSDPLNRISKLAQQGIAGVDPKLGGALVGGLVGGPFGLLIGMNIGASISNDRGAAEELSKIGLNKEVVDEAKKLFVTLQNANDAYSTAIIARDGLREQIVYLEYKYAEYYERAKNCLIQGDEVAARKELDYRQQCKETLSTARAESAEAHERCIRNERSIQLLEYRVREMDDIFEKAATSVGTAADISPFVPLDPLEERFRALEREGDSGKK